MIKWINWNEYFHSTTQFINFNTTTQKSHALHTYTHIVPVMFMGTLLFEWIGFLWATTWFAASLVSFNGFGKDKSYWARITSLFPNILRLELLWLDKLAACLIVCLQTREVDKIEWFFYLNCAAFIATFS